MERRRQWERLPTPLSRKSVAVSKTSARPHRGLTDGTTSDPAPVRPRRSTSLECQRITWCARPRTPRQRPQRVRCDPSVAPSSELEAPVTSDKSPSGLMKRAIRNPRRIVPALVRGIHSAQARRLGRRLHQSASRAGNCVGVPECQTWLTRHVGHVMVDLSREEPAADIDDVPRAPRPLTRLHHPRSR